MSLYTPLIALHVVTAILGLGQLGGLLRVARTEKKSARDPSFVVVRALSSGTRWSLLVMLLSGVALEYLSGGAFHSWWWFRLSFAGVLLLGALDARIGRLIKKSETLGPPQAISRVVDTAWIMCAITAAVAILMELKPW